MSDYDIYNDPNEVPTQPRHRNLEIGLALYRRLAELESIGAEYDLDEVIAAIKEQFK